MIENHNQSVKSPTSNNSTLSSLVFFLAATLLSFIAIREIHKTYFSFEESSASKSKSQVTPDKGSNPIKYYKNTLENAVVSIDNRARQGFLKHYTTTDLRAFWSIAKNTFPKMYSDAQLSKEDKLDIMMAVLALRHFIVSSEEDDYRSDKDYEIMYKKYLNFFETYITDLLPSLKQVPKLLPKRSLKIKKTFMNNLYNFKIHNIVVKNRSLSENILNRLSKLEPDKRFALFKTLVQQHSVGLNKKSLGAVYSSKRGYEVKQNLPKFYLNEINTMDNNDVRLCLDEENKLFHVIFMKEKVKQKLECFLIETVEYICPLLKHPTGHPQEGQLDEKSNLAIKQELIDISNQKNFDPTKDKKRTWVKRYFKIIDRGAISVTPKNGFYFLKSLNKDEDIENMEFFTSMGDIQYGSFLPLVVKSEFRLVFINKTTRLKNIPPDFVADVLIDNLIVEDTPFQKKLLTEIKHELLRNTVFYFKDKKLFLQSLEN